MSDAVGVGKGQPPAVPFVKLADREKDLVLRWLAWEAHQADMLADQVKKLPAGGSPSWRFMADKQRRYAEACRLVASELAGWEAMGP